VVQLTRNSRTWSMNGGRGAPSVIAGHAHVEPITTGRQKATNKVPHRRFWRRKNLTSLLALV